MAGILLTGTAILVLLFVARTLWQYVAAFRKAAELEKVTPIPVVRSYMPPQTPILQLLEPYFSPWMLSLPYMLRHWYEYCGHTAAWGHKGRLPREELGSDVYWVVGLEGRRLYVQDPEVIYDITHRWRDFPKPKEYYSDLRLFGENVVTVEGSEWQYHRRIITASFTEPTMNLVFVEAQQQIVGLIDKIGGRPFTPASVMSKLSTHMIAGSGFGQYMDWSGTDLPFSGSKGLRAHERGKPTTLASVVETFGEHLLPMIVFPAWLLKSLPSPTMNMIGNGKEKFEKLVRAMIQKIRDASQKEKDASLNAARKSDLLSNLVNAPSSVSGGTFSEQDIIGNVFALSFAAEETTSSALQTGLILLAIHTDIQGALQAEVDAICANKAVGEPMDYKTDWPKMRNLMAFMLEAQRTHPSFPALPKVATMDQQITYRGHDIEIPAGTIILYDMVAPHYDPRLWGPDASAFRPSRWLMPSGYEAPPKSINHCRDQRDMLCPPRGAFVAFSEGYRNCLGKKFAQVGFCTLFATLLRTHSVELVPHGDGADESEANWERTKGEAARRIENKTLVISMRINKDVMVRLVRRGAERFPPRAAKL